MTHELPSHGEELPGEKDLKQLQKQEQQVLEKLSEARELQSRALKRFAQAQARVAQMEARLMAVRVRLGTSRNAHSQQKAAPSPEVPAELLPAVSEQEPLDVCAEDLKEAEPSVVRPPLPQPPESEDVDALLAEIAQANSTEAQDTSEADATTKIPVIRQQDPEEQP